MMPHSSTARPTVERKAPTRSRRGAAGSAELGTNRAAAIIPTTITGTLMRNTEPHQKCWSSRPPAMGPTATPTPATPAHIPMAFSLSWGSTKTLVRIESVAGMTSAPPTPMSARVTTRISGDQAKAEKADPAQKTPSPTSMTHLRPKRSPRLPAVSSSPANTTV